MIERNQFYWKDKPITDIHQWAKERGEKMIRYQRIVKSVGPWGITKMTTEGEMPESFWRTLRIESDEQYTQIGEVISDASRPHN